MPNATSNKFILLQSAPMSGGTMQVKKQAKVYDVVVIGSGASGGMAAWNLTRQGVNVLLLDAGTKFDRSTFWTHVLPYEARERRARGEHPPDFFLSEKEQPII